MTRLIVVPRHWAACSHCQRNMRATHNPTHSRPIQGRLLRHPLTQRAFINTALRGIFEFFVDSFDFLAGRLQLKDVSCLT